MINLYISLGIRIGIERKVQDDGDINQEISERFEDLEEEKKKFEENQNALVGYPAWVSESNVRRIKNLKCFEMVRELLLHKVPAIEIARRVHQHGEETNSKLDSLRQYIEHYKATIPKHQFIERLAENAKKLEFQASFLKSDVNVLEEYTQLWKWVKERLEIGVSREKQFGILQGGMEKNFAIAITVLDRIDSVKEKLGLTAPTNEKREQFVPSVAWKEIYGKESVEKVMSNPESRNRVLKALERIVESKTE